MKSTPAVPVDAGCVVKPIDAAGAALIVIWALLTTLKLPDVGLSLIFSNLGRKFRKI